MPPLAAFFQPVQRSLRFPPWYRQPPEHINDGNGRPGDVKIYEPLVSKAIDVEEAEIDRLIFTDPGFSALPRKPRRPRFFPSCFACVVLVLFFCMLGTGVLLFRRLLRHSTVYVYLYNEDVIPIPCHSHNDYWRQEPVFTALRAGCVSIEADVWHLGQEELYIGHRIWELRESNTFTRMYIDPLVKLLEEKNSALDNGLNTTARGVFDMNPSQTLVLLVDLKTRPEHTWPVVVRQLEPLRRRGWLSSTTDGHVRYGPVTVVGTGETDFGLLMQNSTYRDYFFDAPIDELEGSSFGVCNSYYASQSFSEAIGWVWLGSLSRSQLDMLRRQVAEAHRHGLRIRYWGLPSWPISVRNHIWGVLIKEGVDMINVDDVQGAERVWKAMGWPTLQNATLPSQPCPEMEGREVNSSASGRPGCRRSA
ncbi:hypothetical protein SODALDRAFT_106631 [Sodiomyces alkalinus F11]|uniref:Altered inheritance of mitochondria protein 6 n=1 Tax=Sodiomyces alkalinus (strain CBS 110278 / VKM F-3762 / F11) TaxID=1314773 RepID=A0A3N2Q2C5_SODAK|nr:hypothetical protein SODALDRAFT_106631 [Sodiomyces alkalinus F11]ROT40882.1 hypothetical protein SODALDRAFT_106631 [Sodiomyces alkalinus F11]